MNELKVLIIEDNQNDLELIERELTRCFKNVTLKHCSTLEHLAESIQVFDPAIILSDHNMLSFSSVDAIKVARKIKPDIPFLILSGSINEKDAINLLVNYRANDFIAKDNLKKLEFSIARELEKTSIQKKLDYEREEQKRSLKLLSAINDITTSLLEADSLTSIANIITDKIITHFKLTDCVIYEYDNERKVLIQISATGPKRDKDLTIKEPLVIEAGKGIVGHVAKSLTAEIVNDVSKDKRYIEDIESNLSEITVPIIFDGNLIGIIDSEHKQKGFYTKIHLEYLQTVAGIIATKFKAGQERKLSEIRANQLHKNEVLLQKITNNIDAAVFRYVIEASGKRGLTYLSSKTFSIYEVTPEEAIKNDSIIWNQIIDEDKSTVDEVFEEAIKKGKKYATEFRIKTPSGKIKWIEASGTITFADNGDIISDTISKDITENKKIELELIDNEQKLKAITDNIEGLVQRYVQHKDGSNEITFISKGVEKLCQLSQKEVLEDNSVLFTQALEEDRKGLAESFNRSMKELSFWNHKWRIKTPDGSLKWLRGTSHPRKYEKSDSVIWDCLILDITKEVDAEKLLIESNDRLLEAQELTKIGDWSVDLITGETYISPTIKKIYEVDHTLYMEDGIQYYKEGYSRDKIQAVVNEAIEKGTPYTEDLELITAKGNVRWVRAQGKSTFENGQCVRLNGTLMDITEQHNLQKDLIDKEQRLSAAAEGADLGVWEFNFKTSRNYINDKYLEILGYSKKEVEFTYEWFYSLIHPDDLYLINQELVRITEGGEQEIDIVIRMKAKDGSYRILKDKGRIVEFGEDGSIIRLVGTILDITETVELQNTIQQSLDEKVVLLSEIHHRVKNNLAIITGLINLQAMDSDDERLKSLLGDTALRIKSIANVHELLYNTDNFSDISFSLYIENLLDSIQQAINDTTCSIELDIDKELTVNINQAIPMGLLLNELITNSFKYAFDSNNKKNRIHFSLSFDDGNYHGTYSDSGKGFHKENLNKTSSLGALLIHTLLEQLDAEFELETEKGFKITFKFSPISLGAHSTL